MLKMRAPANMSAITLNGRKVEIAEDGAAMVHPGDVPAAASHGFVSWNAPEVPVDVDGMTRSQLIEHHVTLARIEISKQSDDDLREVAKRHIDRDRREPMRQEPQAPRPLTADESTHMRERLHEMTRSEMQSFLRERRVAFGGATGDDKLREMVGAELARPE